MRMEAEIDKQRIQISKITKNGFQKFMKYLQIGELIAETRSKYPRKTLSNHILDLIDKDKRIGKNHSTITHSTI